MRKKINKYNNKVKKQLIQQILLKYFSIKSGNDNVELQKEIDNLINKLKGSGLIVS